MVDYLRALLAPYLPKDNERGASAVEYGLLIAGIAALIVVIVFAFGDNIRDAFEDTCKTISSSGETGGSCAKD